MKGKNFIVVIAILSCLSTSSIYARKKAIIIKEQFTTDEGLCSVKFQGFGAKCGSTKYYFRVDL